MSLETVVGEDSTQIRVLVEINPEEVPDLSLPPVGIDEDGNDRGDGAGFVDKYLDTNSCVEGNAEQVVYDTESVFLVEEIDAGYAGEEVVLEVDMFLEDLHAEEQVILSHDNAELVFDLVNGYARQHLRDRCQLI